MVSVDKVSVYFGGSPLFKEISFLINKRDRIGLVGKNGAGKSTLLKLLFGSSQPTEGNITSPKECTLGYLSQHIEFDNTNTVFKEALKAFDSIKAFQQRIDKYNEELATRTDYESESYAALIDKITFANEQFAMLGGHDIEGETEKVLIGLGFLRSDLDRPSNEFSGGWRMRIELAKVLLKKPKLLLLDEPTNHLDIESIQWLETFLKNYYGALILVSHDKAFLDNVTNRTIEISLGRIYDYKAPYSTYLNLRVERREQQMRAYENQQKLIKETEDFIERFRYKATKAVQVQSRIKQLEKIDRIEVDEEDNSRLNLRFPDAPHSGTIILEAENYSVGYDDHMVLNNIGLIIERGEKVAFAGKNGEGKSTLVKAIMNQLKGSGKFKLGHNIKPGYFAQNQADQLDGNLSVFDTIDHVATGEIRTKIRNILGAFMFGGEESDKKVSVLSGGEKSRLAMIRLLLQPVNMLILDEPTNHLDIQSKEVLKSAIKEFTGTVIIVSHDRDFLDGLVDKVYEFGGGNLKEHLGGISDFLEKKKIATMGELELKQTVKVEQTKAPSQNSLNYAQRKELNKKITKAERQTKTHEDNIAKLEQEQAELDAKLAKPENATDHTLYQRYREVEALLEKEMNLWEESLLKLEELKEQVD